MVLSTQIDDEVGALSIGIQVGEWTQIYASYTYTERGLGETLVFVNGVLAAGSPFTQTAHGPGVFGADDTISIGSGFIGKIRRVQIFSPAVLQIDSSNLFF